MRRGRTGLVAMAVAGALALGGCSSEPDDDASVADVATDDAFDDGDALDDLVLPGERSPASSPATTVPPPSGATSTTTSTTGAPAPTSTSSTTVGQGSGATTSTTSTTSTSTTTTTTTTAPVDADGTRFGPTLLVDAGGDRSTFDWELIATVPGGGQVSSVGWTIDGDSEEVTSNADADDSTIVRIGAEHWRSDTSGTLLAVSADEYREQRQTILDEVLNTDPGAAIAPSAVDGPGTYEVRTSDLATIAAVFGGAPPAGENAVMLGDVELDDALRVVYWSLAYTSDGLGGQTVYILEGRLEPTADVPIERP